MVASPKDLLYGELAAEKRPTGLDDPSCVLKTLFLFSKNTYKTAATLQYDAYSTKITFAKKNYILLASTPIPTWEAVAADRDAWKRGVQKGLMEFKAELMRQAEEKRTQRKAQPPAERSASTFICAQCSRDCHWLLHRNSRPQ
ncbi:hypothetical protein ACROYT_G027227 [Oculina patagonica]